MLNPSGVIPIEPAPVHRYSTSMTSLFWHHSATLTDRSGQSLTSDGARQIDPDQAADPAAPLTALAVFMNQLADGRSPIIGPNPNAQDIADTFFTRTGGSSGTPKTIRRSTDSWAHSIAILQNHLAISPASRVAVLGDLTHSLALYAAVESLTLGADFHFCTAADLGPRGITHLYATPSQLHLLRGAALPDLQQVITGGGPVTEQAVAQVAAQAPNAALTRFYGAAETSFITLATGADPINTIGAAFPGVEIEIRDAGQNRLPVGDVGTVWLRSPMLFDEYAFGTAPHTKRNGAWLTVGEIGALDSENRLILHGRADRIVTVADQSVSLDEMELLLTQHLYIDAAAVVARPHPLRGHTLHAWVEGVEPNIATLPHLHSVASLPELPRLSSGKIDYPALRKLIP